VPCTIDAYHDRQITDWKTLNGKADIQAKLRYGIPMKWAGQVHLGAAALIEAGHPVDTVRLALLPRAGDHGSAAVYVEPFDRTIADKAVDHNNETTRLAIERSDLDDAGMADGLRDESVGWCAAYCPQFTRCRVAQDKVVEDAHPDEVAVQAALDLVLWREAANQATENANQAKIILDGYQRVPLGDGRTLSRTGGRFRPVVDRAQVEADYEAVLGPLPEKLVRTSTSWRLLGTANDGTEDTTAE
jgi:hypothetical protein